MKAFHRETRIERHRIWIRWLATVPFLVAYAGGLLYFLTSMVPKWVDFTMIGIGGTPEQLEPVRQMLVEFLNDLEVAASQAAQSVRTDFLQSLVDMGVEIPGFAEAMIRQPRGPIAALCGTRVTMPYAMSLLSLELVNEYFDGDSTTLGDLTMVAKQRMVDHEKGQKNPYRVMIDGIGKVLSPRPGLLKQECLEHVQLIHLFGDPLLRINRPQKIELASQEIVRAGEALVVKGDSPLSGTITIELCYRRDRFRVRPPRRKTYDSSDASFRKYQEVYEQAHALTCFSESRFVAKGEFEHVIRVPEEAGGRCVVRCLLAADDGFASGSIPVEIRKPIPLREARRSSN